MNRPAGHTPGPWLASRFNPLVEQHDTGRVVAQCDVGARHGQFRITGDDALANARLIAAAPDLLAAAQALQDARAAQGLDMTRANADLVGRASDALSTAIAKATGQG